MYAVGQTLWDKTNKELVLYIGLVGLKKIWIKRQSGKIEKLDSFNQFIHISNEDGQPVPGKYAIHAYFGRFSYKDYKNMMPDESIAPDGVNYFSGAEKPNLNPKFEVWCPK